MRLFFVFLQKCDEIIVLHLGYLNYTQYQVVVSFKGLENITYEIKVKFVVSDKHWQKTHSVICVSLLLHLILFLGLEITGHSPPFTLFVSLLLVIVFFIFLFVFKKNSHSVENVQSHLLTSRNLVPVRLRGVDLHGDGKSATRGYSRASSSRLISHYQYIP